MTHWIHSAVLYQIYPRSFYDHDNNGVGDITGITKKLDYLHDLGIGAIWISPFYPSPMKDFGYDISDYRDIDPIFGNLNDFRALIDSAHSRNIKIIIDFVPNHTSDKHAWFEASKSSTDNPKRDWYTWRSAKPDGSPPNNWLAHFGGPAWTKDDVTGQYYLHSFLPEQPDLNWDNPEVQKAMADTVRYWMEMGVDGLRVDAVNWMSKDAELRDDPIDPDYVGENPFKALKHTHSSMGPHLYDYLRGIEEVVKEFDDRFMIIESYPDKSGDQSHYLSFYHELDPRFVAPFNFEAIFLPWNAGDFRASLQEFITKLRPGDIPVYSFGNHDRSRLVSRVGEEHARLAAMLLLTLPGAPIIYYGDEIGMSDGDIPPENVQDPFELNNPGHGLGRDPERTPMQWNDQPYAGFSQQTPWLPVNDDYREKNVITESQNPDSILNIYKELLRLRSGSEALRHGSFEIVAIHPDILAFTRSVDDETVLILLNFSNEDIVLDDTSYTVHLSTRSGEVDPTMLMAREGRVLHN